MAETLPSPPLSLPQWAQVFKMLGDEIRLRLLLLLAESGPLSVSALCVAADQTQATVSHHLMLMRMSSLVGFRRVGRINLYFVASDYARELLRGIHRDVSERFVEA
jgi:DNA-binding transcriptional ArsR family regulator